MFFFTRGSFSKLVKRPPSLFDAAASASGTEVSAEAASRDNETQQQRQPSIILTGNRPIIWRIDEITVDERANSITFKVEDSTETGLVRLSPDLAHLVCESFDASTNIKRGLLYPGSVILVRSFYFDLALLPDKPQDQDDADDEDTRQQKIQQEMLSTLTITSLIVLGYDLKPQPPNITVPTDTQDAESEQQQQPFELTHTIAQLRPGLSNSSWSMIVKLSDKTPMRDFTNRTTGACGKLCRLLLQDRSGFIEAVMFNHILDKHSYSALKQGSIYVISNGQIKFAANKMMRSWPAQVSVDMELIITEQTTITRVIDQDLIAQFDKPLPKRKQDQINSSPLASDHDQENDEPPTKALKYTPVQQTASARGMLKSKSKSKCDNERMVTKLHHSFITLDQVFFQTQNSLISVMAIIKEIGSLNTIRKRSRPLYVRNIKITDQSGVVCNVALWGKQAEDFGMPVGEVIMLKECQVTNYNGLTLSVLMKTVFLSMARSHDILAVNNLYDWWDRQQQQQFQEQE